LFKRCLLCGDLSLNKDKMLVSSSPISSNSNKINWNHRCSNYWKLIRSFVSRESEYTGQHSSSTRTGSEWDVIQSFIDTCCQPELKADWLTNCSRKDGIRSSEQCGRHCLCSWGLTRWDGSRIRGSRKGSWGLGGRR
jgi:hypothetical protein